ncbi:hypothetical protein [Melittangium boletus]|uniref:hypothetical protein n=1 Tax=Melittangium boletus TaxID=83453 RepID=UPI003DA49EFF
MMDKRSLSGALMAVAVVLLGVWNVNEAVAYDEQDPVDVQARQTDDNGEADEALEPLSSEEPEAQEDTYSKTGFGCPFNEYQCHSHCRSIKKKGGYCGNWARQTCYCY